MLIAYVLVSAYKIYLLAESKSIYWFAITNAIDYGIIGISLIIIFLLKGNRFAFSVNRAKYMLHVSKNYILASMMVVVFQSTDHIMLTMMIGLEENGIYSAAITCATLAQFVYVAIVDSFRPVILSNKKENNAGYSLIEVLAAILLLGILSVPLCNNLVLGHRMNLKSQQLLQAQLEVSAAVEQLMAEGIDGKSDNYDWRIPKGETEAKDCFPKVTVVTAVPEGMEEETAPYFLVTVESNDKSVSVTTTIRANVPDPTEPSVSAGGEEGGTT
jgi:prepilin-type N-terminal cleavage/methylation domain-containing protein